MFDNEGRCPDCGGKMGQTMMGEWWCPSCVGKQIAREASKGLKLNLNLDEKPLVNLVGCGGDS